METNERVAKEAIKYYERDIPPRRVKTFKEFEGEPHLPKSGDIFGWDSLAESLNKR